MTGAGPVDRRSELAGARTEGPRSIRPLGAASADAVLRALVVADDATLRRSLAKALITRGHDVLTAEDGEVALTLMTTAEVDVVLADLSMRRMKGVELLEAVRGTHPDTQLVVMGAHAELPAAADALDAGAYEFVVKPFVSYEAVVHVVERAHERKRLIERVRQLSRVQERDDWGDELLGSSPAVRKVRQAAMGAAATAVPMLLVGEPGTGKETLARAVHQHSGRRGPLVTVSCRALPADGAETELFGAVGESKGGRRRGLVDAAEGGTLWLAEVDALGPAAQFGLARLLRSGQTRACGEQEGRPVDVRMVAACDRDPKALLAEGNLREDLFHELAVTLLWLPPLRLRRDDIPMLAYHFLGRIARRLGRDVVRISPEALRLLRGAAWPGNVQELQSVVQRAAASCRGQVVLPSDLIMDQAVEEASMPADEPLPMALPVELAERPFSEAKHEAVARFEQWYLKALLQRTGGNVSEAGRQSGLDRSNFRRLRRRCGHDTGE